MYKNLISIPNHHSNEVCFLWKETLGFSVNKTEKDDATIILRITIVVGSKGIEEFLTALEQYVSSLVHKIVVWINTPDNKTVRFTNTLSVA